MWSALVLACLVVPAQTTAPAERWPLMEGLQGTYPGWLLDGNNLRLYGWNETSFTASNADTQQLPMGFNYRANDFLLQQNWIRFEKPVDQAAVDPTVGFRIDTILPGSDYRFTIARGLFDSQLTDNQGMPATYGVDPVQFYLEAYIPQVGAGLDIKIGRFFCQFGVESIDTTQNALASRSYTFIYDPFTHTGVLTTLKLDDTWSVQNSIVCGSDVFIDPAARPTYGGGVKWAPPDGRTSVLFEVILGPGRFDTAEQFNNPQIFDVVVTHKVSDVLDYSLEALFGFQNNVPDIGTATWAGLVQYLTLKMTPTTSGTVRLEFFDDGQGQRTGSRGLYTAITAGLNIKPEPWLMIRPEVRYDNNNKSRPFDGSANLFTAALDVVVRW